MKKTGSNEFEASEAQMSLGMSADKMQEVNPDALVIAREAAGLSQSEVARAMNTSQTRISRFEDGISCPSMDELFVLSTVLKQPIKMFTRKDVNRSVFNSFYRKRKSIPQKTISQFNARVSLRQVQVDRLMSKVDIHSEPIPRFDPDDYPGSYTQVAQQLRQFLRLPPGPIKKLMQPLEDVGIVIVLENFGIKKLDGVSTFTNQQIPVIFVNRQMPPSRRRFTIAHEFAHMALHKYLAPDVDEQADALASEFLMPAEDIRYDLDRAALAIDSFADLKLKWRVSIAALMMRAKQLGIITDRQHGYLCAKMAKAGYRIREPHEEYMEKGEPTLEHEMAKYYLNELQYSLDELASVLDVSPKEIHRRYLGETPMLTLL